MSMEGHQHDAVHWHLSEVTSRVIAESGTPSDRHHLGKILMQCMKDDPQMIQQIDGATGESDTNASVLRRCIQNAIAFRRMHVRRGDVVVCMAPNHLQLAVPLYAALFEGVAVAPVDITLGISELGASFKLLEPKLIFCQNEKAPDVNEALNNINLKAKVVTFDDGSDFTFPEILKLATEEEIKNYKAADFDPAETLSVLASTSGTTGLPKHSAATHKNFVIMQPYIWSRATSLPYFNLSLVASPLQWLSAIFNYFGSLLIKFTRLQSSLPMTQEHAYNLINKYRPDFMIMSPPMMATLLRKGDRDRCDFTSLQLVLVGGSATAPELLDAMKEVSPNTKVEVRYGMTEIAGLSFGHGLSSPPGSFGKPLPCLLYRLVDVETGRDINEPYKTGELWMKGPGLFKGYYNQPDETKAAMTEDGWIKSGDLLQRDEYWNFYFVERLKLLLKYRNHQISPVEVEGVIRAHPGVLDVAVTGVPDAECGDLPVAAVVLQPAARVSAQEIKDLVKASLTDTKHLRGGVVFLDKLPLTASTKVHRTKIKEMVLTMNRE